MSFSFCVKMKGNFSFARERRKPRTAFSWRISLFVMFSCEPSIIKRLRGCCLRLLSCVKILLLMIEDLRSEIVFLSIAILFIR